MKNYSSLLVANRGEIASRIFRTANKMGLRTIAIYTEADRHSPYINDADTAIMIETSYLDMEAILTALDLSSAEAIHPGYGFLSENHIFAEKIQSKGIIWVGPNADAIRIMGDKIEAKKYAKEANLPILESVNDAEDAKKIGYPLMIKAAAGGGGKGMRVVNNQNELEESIILAKQESQNAFGDDRIFIERYIKRSRHIEVQIISDHYGNVLHMGERECSIQRRHQKIIEESPSSRLDSEQRAKLTEASISLAKNISYTSAGTVEFLYDDDSEDIWFLEMNTRLQVEHPVTEMVTDIDIVELQLIIADNQELELKQNDISFNGHSIEARIYAEDPENKFLPSSGILLADQHQNSTGIRWDSGVEKGMIIGTDFDPMLAKVIAHDSTRDLAASKLARELEKTYFGGFINNIDFLINILRDDNFTDGKTTTDYIETYLPSRSIALSKSENKFILLAAALWLQAKNRNNTQVLKQIPTGWHNGKLPQQRVKFLIDQEEVTIYYKSQRDGSFIIDKNEIAIVNKVNDQMIDLEFNKIRHQSNITSHDDLMLIQHSRGNKLIKVLPRFDNKQEISQKGSLISPMPGKVIEISVKVGDAVKRGQKLLVMEAMKMNHSINSDQDGIVQEIYVNEGDQLESGTSLLLVMSDDSE
jgi:propionyl-CoA carboxylase alpha chain